MFDVITLSAVVDELNDKLVHGRVQEIVQLDALSFGFEVYAGHARHYLYAGVHANDARIHLVGAKLRGSGEEPSALLALLRKYVEGAFIDRIEQLPFERVLRIEFDHAGEGVSTLVVETIGKYSNLILLDAEGTVLDAVKRVDGSINRVRVTLPRHPYAPPPPQNKLSPAFLDPAKLTRALSENRAGPLWQTLVRSVAGVSPLAAREIAYRVAGRVDAPAGSARSELIVAVLERLSQPPWQPTVALEDDEPAEYAPYELTQYRTVRAWPAMSAAIEAFYGAPEAYAAAKAPLLAALAETREKLARKRDSLAESLPDKGAVERLRTRGELILAYAHSVLPGQRMLAAETENGIEQIELDPELSAVDNAQKYFKEYHRAKDAAAHVPALLAAANAQVAYADQMLNDLELAENRQEMDAVVQAARDAGLVNRSRKISTNSSGLKEPRVVQSRDGFTILVGKNARQNEEITFRRAKPEDVWLHARNVAGAHVVVLRAGREVPESTIQEAARLAVAYSQARGETRADVIVAERRRVHRARGAARRPGMVTITGERVITVSRASGDA